MSIVELEEVNFAERITMELFQDFNLSVKACWSRAFAPFCGRLPTSQPSYRKGYET